MLKGSHVTRNTPVRIARVLAIFRFCKSLLWCRPSTRVVFSFHQMATYDTTMTIGTAAMKTRTSRVCPHPDMKGEKSGRKATGTAARNQLMKRPTQ